MRPPATTRNLPALFRRILRLKPREVKYPAGLRGPVLGSKLDINVLCEAGGLFRYHLRRHSAPLHRMERAAVFVFGMVAGVAFIAALVFSAGVKFA